MMKLKTDRIGIEYKLTFNTPFHCGTGIREVLVDRTVIRDSEGYLYVPGSTLKGVLRERCEQLALFYEQAEPGRQSVHSPHNAKAALLGLGNGRPTMVTRIFGSQNMPGRLFFDDACQSNNDLLQYDSPERRGKGGYKSLQVGLSTQVRLHRPTRTAVPGALYTSEFGANDIIFYGTIQGWLTCMPIEPDISAKPGGAQQPASTPTYSLLLLLAGLRMVERLGGNKSTGKGYCECEITSVKLHEEETAWPSWLEQLDALANYDREGSA
jgi:CRISPR/Cas system CMR subunit Cmr4 (Cas7 group RAMP superfamily)